MAASFPTSIKAFTDIVDGSHYMEATQMNQAYDEIESMQTQYGAHGSTVSHNATLLALLGDYRRGCKVKADTVAQVKVEAGEVVCEDVSGNKKFRKNTSETTVTWSEIDTGSEAASKRYYVHAVADAAATTFTCVVSLSSTAPTGVTTFKLLGSFYNNSSSNIEDVMDDFILERVIPGTLQPWPSDTAPGGAVLCDGAATVGTTVDPTLADLYGIIGTTFGGSDATDFQVPDLRGRVIAGTDDMGQGSAGRVTEANADSPGGVSGDEDHSHGAGTYVIDKDTNWGQGGFSSTGKIAVSHDSGDGKAPDSAADFQITGTSADGDSVQPTMFMSWIIWK